MRFKIVTGLLLVMADPAVAADQGSVGATSRGSVTISASVAPQVRATGVPATMVATEEAAPCIWINTVTRRYDLRSDTAISWSAGPSAARIAGREIDDASSEATSPGCHDDLSARARLALTGSSDHSGSTTLIVSPQ